jgi:hypothetical protein
LFEGVTGCSNTIWFITKEKIGRLLLLQIATVELPHILEHETEEVPPLSNEWFMTGGTHHAAETPLK